MNRRDILRKPSIKDRRIYESFILSYRHALRSVLIYLAILYVSCVTCKRSTKYATAMDRKQVAESFREDLGKCRSKLLKLTVDTVEKHARDEVHKWRLSFDTSSASIQMKLMLDQMEEHKQTEVTQLASELRVSLIEFQEMILGRLAELESFLSSTDLDDILQTKDLRFQLDSIIREMNSLRLNILVEVTDGSMHRRASTVLARNVLGLIKVFDFDNSPLASSSTSDYFEPLKNFVRRLSSTGASYYNVDLVDQKTHF